MRKRWAEYFEESAKSEARLLLECIYTYIKANNPKKTSELLEICQNKHEMETGIQKFKSTRTLLASVRVYFLETLTK